MNGQDFSRLDGPYNEWIGPDGRVYVGREGQSIEEILSEALLPLPEMPKLLPALTARQLRLGLVTNGIMLEKVEAAIISIEDAQARSIAKVEWEYASQFERSHPLVAQIGATIGLSVQELDAMWLRAATL